MFGLIAVTFVAEPVSCAPGTCLPSRGEMFHEEHDHQGQPCTFSLGEVTNCQRCGSVMGRLISWPLYTIAGITLPLTDWQVL